MMSVNTVDRVRGPDMSVRVSVILGRKGGDVVTIPGDAAVIDAVAALGEHNIGALVVSETGDTVDGIISERDIVRRLAQDGATVLQAAVADVMTADVRTCGADETADQVMQTMTTHRLRHLPVLEDGRLVGVVSIGDVVKSRIDDLTTQAESMQDYISGSV